MLFLRWYFFVAPNLLLGCCALLFWRRRLQRNNPIFAAYVGFLLLEFVILFITDLLIVPSITSLATYRWLLVVGTGVAAALQIGVLYELAGELLLSRSSLAHSVGPLLRWSLATALLVGVGFSALFPRTGSERIMLAFQVLDFASNLMGVGLLLALMLCTRALRISWRNLPAGIALGFGINASAELCGAALLSVFVGRNGYVATDFIRTGSYHLCVLIWLIYILKPDQMPSFTGNRLGKADLETWDQELQKMVR
jgi:hypothetical protein